MSKLTVIDKKFYVNQSERTVVCKIEYKFENEFYTFTGKSKCDPREKFDELKGRHIAESRAKVKAYTMAKKSWEDFHNYMYDAAYEALDNVDYFDFLMEREQEHVYELTR